MDTTRHFRLRPFAAGYTTENLSLAGNLVRRPGAVQVRYRVEGALDGIYWPSASAKAGRCHELWRQTCFELFFGIKGDSAYWEVNWLPCAPWEGEYNCWNVYHFTDYRSQMREESIGAPVCHAVQDAGLFSYTCTLACQSILDDTSDLEVGVSSVIKARDGSTSYWALSHHGTEPDFHNRTSFSMLLPGLKSAR